MYSFLLYTTFALETKENSNDKTEKHNVKVKQTAVISLTAMRAARLHFSLFPQATSTTRMKLIR